MRFVFFFKIFILAFTIDLLPQVNAQENFDQLIKEVIPLGDLPNAELLALRKDLQVQTLVIESILEIQEKGGSLHAIDEATNNLRRSINMAMDARTIQLGDRLQTNVKEILETTVAPTKVKGQVSKLTHFVQNDLIKKRTKLSSLTRRFGLQVGLFYLAMVQIDYTIPLFLISTGTDVALGAKLFASPISSTTTAAFIGIRSVTKYRHLIKSLGFKDTIEHYNIFKKVTKFVNKSLFSESHLINSKLGNRQVLFTVEESNLISRLIQRFGYKKSINYNNLVQVLEENNLYRGFLRRLQLSEGSDILKTLKIIAKIEREADPKTVALLRKNFGKKINIVKGIYNLDSHVQWFLKLAHIEKIDDLFKLLAKMPDEVAPHSFDKVWRNFVLPQLSESFGPYYSIHHYKSMRLLMENYNKDLRADFMSSKEYKFNHQLKEKLNNYLFDSLFPLGSCGTLYKKQLLN